MKPTTHHVLLFLKDSGGRGATTSQLCQPWVGGVRFSARIKELRDMGYRITCERESQSSSRYKLVDVGIHNRKVA